MNAAAPRVLIVDDERNIRTTLTMCLQAIGCEVTAVASGDAALLSVAAKSPELAFVDLRLANESGLDLIPRLLGAQPDLAIVVITAYATVDTAVEAIRRGARDYLPKPFTPAQIRQVVEQVMHHRSLAHRIAFLEQRLAEAAPEIDLGTTSPRMRSVLTLVERVAVSEASVLLRGESGTGKGVLARTIHLQSPRRAGPFVVVNCPTLSEELLASELFGHVRGAFTGAVRDQAGKVEAAQGGTLFLDEIAELSPPLQAKLLRFLQEKAFERVGETRTRRADVRVLTATNRDLEADVAAGRFREDLLYRLNVLELALPALRDRPEDILALARRFLAFFARDARRAPPDLSPAAEAALVRHPWPGNVRELRNLMERVTILWPAPVVEPEAFPERMVPPRAAADADRPRLGADYTLEALEREHILRVLARAPSQEEAARILGIDVSTLWRKRRKYEES